jgi:fatty acid desaturase
VEWPTVAVAVASYASWVALVAGHRLVPVWGLLLGLAVLGAWHGSLRHEVIHGHPTRWQRLNWVIAAPPLDLLHPFSRYRDLHLAHHVSELTDPAGDPESFYVTPEEWARAGRARRAWLTASMTLIGRVTIGPFHSACAFLRREARALGATWRTWLGHAVAVAFVLWVVVGAAGMPLWTYLVGFVYGGASLTLLRSFAEHRAVGDGTRSAVVQSNAAMGLLFLNNNLHHTHHARPGLAWYRLPQASRQLGSSALAASGAGSHRGYWELVRRYAWRPIDHPAGTVRP